MNLRPKRDQKQMEKVQKEKRDDPAIEGARSFREAREKAFIFKGLKTKKPKKEPTVAKRHIYRALPVIGISSIVALLSIYFFKPLSTQKVIEFSGNKAVDQQLLYEKVALRKKIIL